MRRTSKKRKPEIPSKDRKRVERTFEDAVDLFMAKGAFTGSRPRLKWGAARDFPKPRDHAYTDGKTVTLAPRMARADLQRVAGVLAHELAHVAAIRAGWPDHGEANADQIARHYLGTRQLGYDADDVQRIGPRRKRPGYLPR